jgi:small subunit ribosomal protein S6
MRTYELTIVVATDVSEEEMNVILAQVQAWIEESKGTVVKLEPWGRRKLAYGIEEFNEGHYYQFECQLDPKTLIELERNLKLSTHILRHLLIRPGE